MSPPYKLPPIATIGALPARELATLLSHLFEPSAALAGAVHTAGTARTTTTTPYADYAEFVDAVAALLFEMEAAGDADADRQLREILGAHPRLGAARVDSVHSRNEQKSLVSNGDGDGDGNEEAGRLAELNARYEETFPGLRYVVFVNGRSRPVIMEDMERRIARNDIRAEKLTAIEAMRDIAKDRASKLLA